MNISFIIARSGKKTMTFPGCFRRCGIQYRRQGQHSAAAFFAKALSGIVRYGLDIEIEEIKNLANYLNTPHLSTQHGVKGESHLSAILVAADNYSTPNVRMYSFFELWSRYNISLPEFEDLFYSYSKIIMEVEA